MHPIDHPTHGTIAALDPPELFSWLVDAQHLHMEHAAQVCAHVTIAIAADRGTTFDHGSRLYSVARLDHTVFHFAVTRQINP